MASEVADLSDHELIDSDAESQYSEGSASSGVSAGGTPRKRRPDSTVPPVQLHTPGLQCGAIFSHGKKGAVRTFVCLKDITTSRACGRAHHKDAAPGPAGFYSVEKTTKGQYDGDLSTYRSEEGCKRDKDTASKKTQSEMAAQGLRLQKAATSPETNIGSKSSGLSSAVSITVNPPSGGSTFVNTPVPPGTGTSIEKPKGSEGDKGVSFATSSGDATTVASTLTPKSQVTTTTVTKELMEMLRGFKEELSDMKMQSQKKEHQALLKQAQVIKTNRKRDTKNASKSSPKYVGVVFGKNGGHGVFPLSESRKAKALHKSSASAEKEKFTSKKEAWSWVKQKLTQWDSASDSEDSDWDDVPDLTTKKFEDSDSEDEAPIVKTPGPPPLNLGGSDISAKKKDEMFGICLRTCGASALRKQLCPPGLSSDKCEDLCETVLDGVSLPGKNNSSEAENTLSNVERALESLAENSRQRLKNEELAKDLKWRQSNRTSLKGITSLEKLQVLAVDVSEFSQAALDLVVANQQTILSSEPWEEDIKLMWSQGGYIFRISFAIVQNYLSLLQHLIVTGATLEWDETKETMDFFLRKISMIRDAATCRIQCMCRIYIFLRDGALANWRFGEFEAVKLRAMQKKCAKLQATPVDPSSSQVPKAPGVCKKCGTGLHGSNSCPFSEMTGKEAKKAAKKLILGLATGGDIKQQMEELGLL